MSYLLLSLSALIAGSISLSPFALPKTYAVLLEKSNTSKIDFDNQKSRKSISTQSGKADRKEDTTIIQTQGSLDSGDERLPNDNSLYESYEFDGQAGQRVVIQMNSSAFDTYLILLDSNGDVVEQNDDYQGSTDSLISTTLPRGGTHSVIANTYDASGRGSYTLSVTGTISHTTRNQSPQASTEVIAQENQGVAEGVVGYPSDYKPESLVCAQSVSNLYLMSCVESPISEGMPSFSMTLDPGEYFFFSYVDEMTHGGTRGTFTFHTPSSTQSGNSHRPQPVSVGSGQTVNGLSVSDSATCREYSQYCIAPPDISASSRTSQRSVSTPRLRSGAYYRGAYVSVYEHNGQFCYSGFSRNGSLVASISEDPSQPNTYLFDQDSGRGTRVFQVDANTLSYGGSEYERINDTLPFDQLGPDMQTCLTSVDPYYESEERTDRGRPPQNR